MSVSARPRIGLLGGSFDPPHLAHLALGRQAIAELRLDELRWLPAGAPWQKADRPLAAPEHRAAMVAALIAGEDRCVLDERELRRNGPTYTIDTVRELQAEQPGADWFLVIGQDQLARFDTWRDWRELLQRLTLAVAAREDQAFALPPALADQAQRVLPLALPRLDVSASAVRAQRAAGAPVAPLVGEAVARYIDRHGLYGPTPRS